MKLHFGPYVVSLAVVCAMAGPARSAIHTTSMFSFGDETSHFGRAKQKLPVKTTIDEDARRGAGRKKTDIVRSETREKAAKLAYELGVRYGVSGRYEEAVSAFSEAVLYNSQHANAHFGLGHALYDLGRWSEATEAFRRATELNRKDFEAFNYLGAAYFKQGLYEEAIDAYKQVLVLNPVVTDGKYADVRYNIANAFYKSRRFEPAIRYYMDVSYSRPKSAELLNDLGAAYAELGRFKDAKEAFTRATKLNPDDAYAQNNLALSYYVHAQHQDAFKAFERAVRIAPSNMTIRLNVGIVSAASSTQQSAAVGDRVSLLAKTGAGSAREGIRWLAYSHIIHGIETKGSRIPAEFERDLDLHVSTSADNESVGRPVPSPLGGGTVAPPSGPTSSSTSRDPVGRVLTPGAKTPIKAAELAPIERATPVSAGGPSLAVAKPTDIYRVGVGDVLDIRLLEGQTKESTLYVVLTGGLVDYQPLKEPFTAAGKTVDEIAEYIKSELRHQGVLGDARVVVGVREYVSHTVIVSGLVAEPGAKVLRREAVPLYVVMAYAQPLPEAGRALVTSYASGKKTELSLANPEELNMLLQPGDVVNVVAKREEFYYIGGKVESPGEKEFHSGITLTQAILAAGGLLHSSKSAVVTRQNAEGFLTTTRHALKELTSGKVPDPPLRPGDRVEVIR